MLPVAACVCDAAGRVTFFNRRAAELLRSQPALGEPWAAFCATFEIYLPDGSLARPDATPMALAAREGRVFHDVELRIVRPDGSSFIANTNIEPLRDADGRLAGAVNVFQDVTARRSRERNAAFLASLGQEIALLTDAEEIVAVATRSVGEHLGTQRCCFVEAGGADRVKVTHDWRRDPVASIEGNYDLKSFGGTKWWATLSTRTLAVADTHADPHTRELRKNYDALGVRAYATAPFIRDGRWVAALAAAGSAPHPWTAEELELLENLVARVWPLVERARVAAELQHHARMVENLNRAGAALVAELDLEKIVQRVTDAGREITGAAFGAFFYNVKNERGESYTLYTLSGAPREAFSKFPMPRNTPLFGPTFRGEGVVRIADVRKDPRFGGNAPYHGMPEGHLPVCSYLAAPVKSRSGEVLGGLFFGHPEPNVFTADAEATLASLAAQAAIAIDNANLYHALERELAEHKRIEQALRESEAKFQAILDNSATVIFAKDIDGRYLLINRQHEKLFQVTRQQMLGKTDFDIFPAPMAQAFHDNDRQVISSGEPCEFEEIAPHKDGPHTYISIKFPLRDTQGRIYAIAGIATDITERKRGEVQQRTLYELVARVNRAAALPEIYDAALEGIRRSQNADRASILLYDSSKVMRFVAWQGLSDEYRRAVEGHSPWGPEETDAKPVCIEDVSAVPLEPTLRGVIEREGIRALAFIPITYEKRLLGKFMVYFNAVHRFAPDTLQPMETIASQVAFAIERRKSAEALEALVGERTASLRKAIEQMEEFSYSVSHDLRSPVRAMRGYAEALLVDHGAKLDDEGRELLDRIQRNGSRMDRLIQDLLTYTRLARRELCLEPVSVDRLVREVIEHYPEMGPQHASIEILAPLPEVLAHEPSLTQVVSNLLGNAVKFVAPGTRPHVRVGFDRMPTGVRLWFQDNGIGIAPEYQQRLFGMFERAHPGQKFEGTGIGLAIVRKAMERMNGSAGVESDGKSGSRFWIELPLSSRA